MVSKMKPTSKHEHIEFAAIYYTFAWLLASEEPTCWCCFVIFAGGQDGVDLLVDFASLWVLLGVSFESIFHFIFVLTFGGVKKSHGLRQELPVLSLPGP